MRKTYILLIVIGVFILGLYFWWNNGLASVDKKNNEFQSFVIPKGTAVRAIGNNLKEEGLIRDPVVFFIYIKMNNLDRGMQAGSYKLSPSMNLATIVKTLRSGSEDIWVTVPEGYRAAEIAETLKRSIPTYQDNWTMELEKYEGYLFPDTYLIPKDAGVQTVISIMTNNFNKKIAAIGLSKDSKKIKDIITVASLIEREALRDEEKPMISSVINNRLELGMALDIDATLQYIKGKDRSGKWWTVPTGADKSLNSLYNTYKYPGIPPGPIANPGIAAIEAAMNPAESSYLFYIHDRNGDVHFSKNLSEHNQNIEKYLN